MTKVLIFNDMAKVAWARTIGPYRVATALRNEGYETQVVEHFLWAAIVAPQYIWNAIEKFVTKDTLVIGFSVSFFQQTAMSPSIRLLKKFGFDLNESVFKESNAPYIVPLSDDFLKELKERVHRINPKVKFLVGGSAKNKVNLQGTIFDAQILGFADRSMPAYVKYLDGKNPFFQLNDGHIDYDQSIPGYDVSEAVTHWTAQDIMVEGERLPIEVSRGCIFQCKFCGYALTGKKKLDYIKPAEVLERELRHNHEAFGIKDYWFTDDTFNDTTTKVEGIHKVLTSLPFKINFRTYLRLDLLNAHRQVIDLVTEAGLDLAIFGVESLNYENAKLVGKGMHTDKVLALLDQLWTQYGWKDRVFMLSCLIAGLPHDSKDNMQWLDTVFSDDFKSDQVSLSPLFLVRTASELFSSEFDRNPAKYGYEFDSDWAWRNVNTGMTFDDAKRIVEKALTNNRSKNLTSLLHESYRGQSKQELFAQAKRVYNFEASEKHKVIIYLFKERLTLMRSYFSRLMNL